jgi:parallel beta-helix repeat protein
MTNSFKKSALLLAASVLSTLNFQLSALAQGNLTPPGAPAPTMKTLDQVEPRTPIMSLPFNVTRGGSYYVTSNLTSAPGLNGITVSADNVTIDLNGCALVGISGSGSGIFVSGHTNLCVRNGTIASWGSRGINAGSGYNSVFQDLRLTHNVFGGLIAGPGSQVNGCLFERNGGESINAGDGSVVRQCLVRKSGGDGIVAGSRCRIADNTSESNTGAGVRIPAAGRDTLVEGNLVVSNTAGLSVSGTENVIRENTVKHNGFNNYDFAAGNHLSLLLYQIPETIEWPASVKLAGPLTTSLSVDGITIDANDVTIDLNGFGISCTAPSSSASGILIGGAYRNITIQNGFIRGGVTNNGSDTYTGPGFSRGISSLDAPLNVVISRVSISGCKNHGIFLGNNTVVESCVVQTMGGLGITGSLVNNSSATDCGDIAITCNRAVNCTGESTGADGIFATIAENCYGHSETGDGVFANVAQNCYGHTFASFGAGVNAEVAQNCYGFCSSSGTGVAATRIAIGCYGFSNTGTGLSALIANSCRGATTSGTAQSITFKYNMP